MPMVVTPITTLKDWFLRGGEITDAADLLDDIPRILVLDGGVSTHLEDKLRQQRQNDAKHSPNDASSSLFPYRELWSSGLLLSETGRQQVLEGHLDWLRAGGVHVISTATYQSHYVPRLWPQRPIITEKIMDQMWNDGIALAQRAVETFRAENPLDDRPLYVVASSGGYGAALSNGAEYTGHYFDDDDDDAANMELLQSFHLRKLQAAAATHPDGIAIETVPSLLECQALAQLLQSNAVQALLWNGGERPIACYITFSCRNGIQLNDGTDITQALKALRGVPYDTLQAIGFNCCSVEYLPALLRTLVREIVQFTPRRGIVVFPNSGETWNAAHQHWEKGTGMGGMDHQEAAQIILHHTVHAIDDAWEELRLRIPPLTSDPRTRRKPSVLIGGCCRTTVETIGALRSLVDEYIRDKNGEP